MLAAATRVFVLGIQRVLCSTKQSISLVNRVFCLYLLVIVMALLLLFNESHWEHIEYLWTNTTPISKTSSSSSSLSTQHSNLTTVELEKEYHVFHNACLEALGERHWSLRSPIRYKEKLIKFRNFVGLSGWVAENFHVIHDKKLNMIGSINNNNSTIQRHQKGTYMITSNTHANNFHHINDVLLPVFRLFQKTEVTGLLIPEGYVNGWEARLPIQNIGLDMMNMTVLYPMEELISNTTPPMCFDRLIIKKIGFRESPYFKRWGRFSKLWPHSVFTDFRNSMYNYVQSQIQLQEIGQYNLMNIANNTKDSNITANNGGSNMETIEISSVSSKPVLSWISRASDKDCLGRCITNKQDAAIELSKYFDVNILDFTSGLTTLQALAYVQKTDVLIGLHGAGLAYTAFLNDRAMLVELKGDYSNRMMMNMASTMNIPYYAISLHGCVGPGTTDVYTLPSDRVNDIAKEIYEAYLYEKKKVVNEGPSMTDGKCEFPQPVEPCGHLSSKDKSRCYLRKRFIFGFWFQCAWHQSCHNVEKSRFLIF